MWHEFAAQQGNAPGAQQGDVIITFVNPVGGIDEVTVPSNDVTFAAEGGSLIGLQLLLEDGRRLFAAAGNIAGVVDAPLQGDDRGHRDRDRPATGGRRPEEGLGLLPRDSLAGDGEQDPELEARVPAANRTDEQRERAEQRERDATAAQDAAAREDDKRQREAEQRERAERQDDGEGQREARQQDDGEGQQQGSEEKDEERQQPARRARGTRSGEPVDAATDRADAAHDRADAATDREASARERAAQARKPGK